MVRSELLRNSFKAVQRVYELFRSHQEFVQSHFQFIQVVRTSVKAARTLLRTLSKSLRTIFEVPVKAWAYLSPGKSTVMDICNRHTCAGCTIHPLKEGLHVSLPLLYTLPHSRTGYPCHVPLPRRLWPVLRGSVQFCIRLAFGSNHDKVWGSRPEVGTAKGKRVCLLTSLCALAINM